MKDVTQERIVKFQRFPAAATYAPEPKDLLKDDQWAAAQTATLPYIPVENLSVFDKTGNIRRFDCTLAEFDALPIARRLHWIRQFMKQIPQAKNWFNNIAGIIEGFVEYGLAAPGSWLSIVDAAILHGIQDGYALAAGIITGGSVNPGGPLWRHFFDALAKQVDDVELINLWGTAETASTNYGVELAAGKGLSPNRYEWVFLQTGNLYRWAVASFDDGISSPVSWLGTSLHVVTGAGDGRLSFDFIPALLKGQAKLAAGILPGALFVDPRALWNGRSPVYWYSTAFIWANQQHAVRWS